MVQSLILSQGKLALIDDADYALVGSFKWYFNGRCVSRNVQIGDKRKSVKLHRFIMNAAPGQSIDHINGDVFDNRRCNLRFCTQQQNCWNSKAAKERQFKGVKFDKRVGYWAAVIRENGKSQWLGTYNTELDAAYAYNVAAKSIQGDFARLNKLPAGFVGASRNTGKNPVSGIPGVRLVKSCVKPWQAYLRRSGRFINLGRYLSIEAASYALRKATSVP